MLSYLVLAETVVSWANSLLFGGCGGTVTLAKGEAGLEIGAQAPSWSMDAVLCPGLCT